MSLYFEIKAIKSLKDYLSERKALANEHGQSSILKKALLNDKLWGFTRRSVSCGVAAGLLVAFIPLPVQTICAIACAILLRGNVVIAAACTWISNPITFIPINIMLFKVGQLISGSQEQYHHIKDLHFAGDSWRDYIAQFLTWFAQLGKSILIGLPIVSIAAALLGFLLVHIFWDLIVKLHSKDLK